MILNGFIIGVINYLRNDIVFIVDVNIVYEEDIEKVINVIKNICDEFKDKNLEYINEIIEVKGIIVLGVLNVIIRMVGKVKLFS